VVLQAGNTYIFYAMCGGGHDVQHVANSWDEPWPYNSFEKTFTAPSSEMNTEFDIAQCAQGSYSIGFFTVCDVQCVYWETYPGNTWLDSCPNNGGLRVFPDKESPDQEWVPQRAWVLVNAIVTPPIENMTVFFRLFDVDDPSSNTAPVDSNDGDGDRGDDNRSVGSWGGLVYGTTDSDGKATIPVEVSMQPGDNYRMVARCGESYMMNLTLDEVEDGDDDPAPEHISDMLTVWRRLHIELDSMGPEYDTGWSTDLTDVLLTDTNKNWSVNQFNSYDEDWDLCPDSSQQPHAWFDICATYRNAIQVVQWGEMTEVANSGDCYIVEFKGFLPEDTLRGDLPDPDTGGFEEAFREVYILPLYDTGKDNAATPWHRNFNGSAQEEDDYEREWVGAVSSCTYWACTIVSLYDTTHYDVDNHPDTELGLVGIKTVVEPICARLYEETLRDISEERGWTAEELGQARQEGALHEAGHFFNVEHDSSPTHIMWAPSGEDQEDNLTGVPLRFSDQSKTVIRGCPLPD
jgi:hypothetical protein